MCIFNIIESTNAYVLRKGLLWALYVVNVIPSFYKRVCVSPLYVNHWPRRILIIEYSRYIWCQLKSGLLRSYSQALKEPLGSRLHYVCFTLRLIPKYAALPLRSVYEVDVV